MSKKILASALMAFGLLSAAPMMATAADLKVGMVTDSGSIDDKSFNQGTWDGIRKATKDLGVKSKYLKPGGTTELPLMVAAGAATGEPGFVAFRDTVMDVVVSAVEFGGAA